MGEKPSQGISGHRPASIGDVHFIFIVNLKEERRSVGNAFEEVGKLQAVGSGNVQFSGLNIVSWNAKTKALADLTEVEAKEVAIAAVGGVIAQAKGRCLKNVPLDVVQRRYHRRKDAGLIVFKLAHFDAFRGLFARARSDVNVVNGQAT